MVRRLLVLVLLREAVRRKEIWEVVRHVGDAPHVRVNLDRLHVPDWWLSARDVAYSALSDGVAHVWSRRSRE